MDKNIPTNTTIRNRIETVFDACKYRGCRNRRLAKGGGVHLFRFPSRGDSRLLTWIKHTGNKLILNWSLSTLRKAGICGDHFSNDSFHNTERTKLKSNAVPEPYKEPDIVLTANSIWDHTYSRETAEKKKDAKQNFVDNPMDEIPLPRQYKCLDKVKIQSKSCKIIKLPDGRPQWRTNPTFIRTYSRKLSFKDADDSMEWTAIEPGSAKGNVGGEPKASEALKLSVSAVKTAAADVVVQEHENREMKELRMIIGELRRQNEILRIENFELQLRLATATESKKGDR